MAKFNREEIIYNLAKAGYSYAQIGKLFNITKQRIYILYKEQKKRNVPLEEHLCDNCGVENDTVFMYMGKFRLCKDCANIISGIRRRKRHELEQS